MGTRQFVVSLGSTGGSPVGDGGLAIVNFSYRAGFQEMLAASRRKLQASRLCSPDGVAHTSGGLS